MKTKDPGGIRSYTVEPSQADTEVAKAVRSAGKKLEVSDDPPPTEEWRTGKRRLHLTPKKGESLHSCASMDPRYICCNMAVLEAVSNCPFNCTYCFLQSYLNDTTVKVVADVDALMAEVREKTTADLGRLWRIGTWELGDSLALEDLTGSAGSLIRAFAELPNALLELRTKSACVESILGLPHAGRTVVGWTMNPSEVITLEERGTASVDERLRAMAKVVAAGYMVSLHFDPMILHDGWERGYNELFDAIFDTVSAEHVAWISVGALRFNPEMKKLIVANYPATRVTIPEMVLGPDGKVRYVKPLRVQMFHLAAERIAGWAPATDPPFVYLCMERWDVWRKVLGHHPRDAAHLDALFTASLRTRFPHLG